MKVGGCLSNIIFKKNHKQIQFYVHNVFFIWKLQHKIENYFKYLTVNQIYLSKILLCRLTIYL